MKCLFFHNWIYKTRVQKDKDIPPIIYRICKKCDEKERWFEMFEG